MWYPATVTTPAASEPVTLDQAKKQCGISGTDHDARLNLAIAAARAEIENYCGIKIITQTVEVKCDGFQDFRRLSAAPIQSITSVKYFDTDGVEQTLDSATYELRKEGLAPAIVLAYAQRWPNLRAGSRITVQAVVGYQTVPSDIVQAILLMVSKFASSSGRDVTIRSETVEGVGSTQWASAERAVAQLDTTARTLLETYRNWPL